MSKDAEFSSRGSLWRRWEPHIHAPGTKLNNQFSGADAWERYVSDLETASPMIEAIGVTDYYSTDTYVRLQQAQAAGRLPRVGMIFPNIEMRLDTGTVKGRWVNVHLLVSPDQPNHLTELHRFLGLLTFVGSDATYRCTPDDLIQLGQRAGASEASALAKGSEQFKVSLDQLQQIYDRSDWAQANILVAVPGADDGAGGVRDAADTMLRQKIERFAHVIFASSAAQRDFWLGRRAASLERLTRDYGGAKPCLHGCDAHAFEMVARPAGERYSWLKGAPRFDTLRQACVDPSGRAFVGEAPPITLLASQVIDTIEITGADWAQTPRIALNEGLVAVIGPRGSGKTALADMIAAGCEAADDGLTDSSFLVRAKDLLAAAGVRVRWRGGELAEHALISSAGWDDFSTPRIRYLSQQFVEALCSSDGMTDALVSEIQRVIFEAHPPVTRDGATDFDDLLTTRATRHREARMREEDALAVVSDRIGVEIEKRKLAAPSAAAVKEKEELIGRLVSDRNRLIAPGSEARAAELAVVLEAIGAVQANLRWFSNQQQSLLTLKDEVRTLRSSGAPEALRAVQARHAAGHLTTEEWANFLLSYAGDVDGVIAAKVAKNQELATGWRGVPPPPHVVAAAQTHLRPGVDPKTLPLATLEAERARLEKLVAVDRDISGRFAAVSQRILSESGALGPLRERSQDCAEAAGRIPVLMRERDDGYTRIFEAIIAEQSVLEALYAPLMQRLDGSSGTLGKLTFAVQRTADVAQWARAGEALLDLRRLGPFKGRGTLLQIALETLRHPWERGGASTVATAISEFRSNTFEEMIARSPVPVTDVVNYRAWLKKLALWMFSTSHISLGYSIEYDGVDVRKLSPGTRGIVLLLLYLALDLTDDRPLLIDQPEENLDPKSIFDELVPLFLEAKTRRQVILVTHNANLVVNTDADQIIVAAAGPHAAGRLPPITYTAGGLDEASIRTKVVDILEGGEAAFRERARRLRVNLSR